MLLGFAKHWINFGAFFKNQSHRSMNIRQYSMLHYFDCGQNLRGKCALIVTECEFDPTDQCSKITSFIKEMWKESKFQVCTSSAKELVDKFDPKKNGFLEKNSSDGLKSSFNQKIASVKSNEDELSIFLQFITEAIQNELLDVSGVLIASNKSFSIPQIFDYLQLMFACHKVLQSKNVSISSVFGHSYTCVLPEGYSELQVCSGHEGDYCGVLPIGDAVTLTTTGLVWNLNNSQMKFGGLISSSNKLDGSGKVTIDSDGPVLWTMGVNCAAECCDD